MKFTQAIKPHIDAKLDLYRKLRCDGNDREAFFVLEDAHVLGQQSTYYHCLIHYYMFQHDLRFSSWTAALGQVLRLVGAFSKTAMGLVPKGNTGGSNISPFKSLPVSAENQAILDKVNHAQS